MSHHSSDVECFAQRVGACHSKSTVAPSALRDQVFDSIHPSDVLASVSVTVVLVRLSVFVVHVQSPGVQHRHPGLFFLASQQSSQSTTGLPRQSLVMMYLLPPTDEVAKL